VSATAREIRFARRPGAEVSAGDFAIETVTLPEPAEGEVVVENLWMSLDPYMRLPLSEQQGLHAGIPLGATMDGAALGVVTRSRAPGLPVGAHVVSQRGWRDAFTAPAAQLRAVDPDVGSLSWYVGILGLIGLTACTGIDYVLEPVAGETVYVSGAAGAVGMVACQLAKRRGARVIGTAGSAEKVEWLRTAVGLDAAANYHTDDVAGFLREQCPQGLDVYFDNVGGATLDAALGAMKVRGRIGLCGAIAQYNDANYRAGPSDFFTIIEKSLTVLGFNAGTWGRKGPEMLAGLAAMLKSGELRWTETVVEGLEAAPAAFVSLFTGGNTGKLVVRLRA
jgi:NADPH-dependent curcumin reductase CurA